MTVTIPTSGTGRRRAKAVANRERVEAAVTIRVENLAFWEHGITPASATTVSVCSCGAKAFTRDPDGHLDDFAAMHSFCDEYEEQD